MQDPVAEKSDLVVRLFTVWWTLLDHLDRLVERCDGATPENGQLTEEMQARRLQRKRRARATAVGVLLVTALLLFYKLAFLLLAGLWHIVALVHTLLSPYTEYAPSRVSLIVTEREIESGALRGLRERLEAELYDADPRACGVGAPLVGHLRQALLLRNREAPIYNPQVLERLGEPYETSETTELCNGTAHTVRRWPSVRVQHLRGIETFEGTAAQCLQHYCDVFAGEWHCSPN